MEDPRCTWLRLTTGDGPVLVKWERRDGGGDRERLVREVDVFRVEDDRIVEQTHYCPGVWDAAIIARQRAEASMVGAER